MTIAIYQHPFSSYVQKAKQIERVSADGAFTGSSCQQDDYVLREPP
jgi:hypothetical protein